MKFHPDEMLRDLAGAVAIPSVSVPGGPETAPFGEAVAQVLHYYAELGRRYGFAVRELHYVTEISFGRGQETVYLADHADVVPATGKWNSDPFEMTVRDGVIYGRGVTDNKGPAIAVLHAMKALKDEGIVPQKQIRLIIGGCEEVDMRDLHRYVQEEGLPDFGLTPDSEYPVVNTEVGVLFSQLSFAAERNGTISYRSLSGAAAANIVPEDAQAELESTTGWSAEELSLLPAGISVQHRGKSLVLRAKGVPAHGSVPWEGKNALLALIGAVGLLYERRGERDPFTEFATRYLCGDFYGEKLGIACRDELCGPLSVNVGTAYHDAGSAGFSLDIRVPATLDSHSVEQRLSAFCRRCGAEYRTVKLDEGTTVAADSPFMRRLMKVYETVSGEPGRFITARGVTYAKAFGGRGVAFGPERADGRGCGNIHGNDEFMTVDTLTGIAEMYYAVLKELFV